MTSVKKVLIVGGGIGGLCAAIGLRDRGIAVDMVEIKKEWTVYGVGIIQQCNVVRAMAQLGMLDRYLGSGFPFEQVSVYIPNGMRVATLPGVRLAGPDYPANIGVSRRKLHNTLTSAAIEKGTQVRLGVTMSKLEQTANKVSVQFTDGSTGEYDVVIGADGTYSKMRPMILGEAWKPSFSGQGVWRHNFVRHPEVDHLMAYNGAKGNGAGFVPLAPELMYLYVTYDERSTHTIPEDQLPQIMRDRLDGFPGLVAEHREKIVDPKEIVYRPIDTVFVADKWHNGRVVLIGDAVHTMTPHLGQGAGMAIEDAVVLSELLPQDRPIESLFEEFMRRRYDRCKFVQDASMQICQWQLDNDPNMDQAGMTKKMIIETAKPI